MKAPTSPEDRIRALIARRREAEHLLLDLDVQIARAVARLEVRTSGAR